MFLPVRKGVPQGSALGPVLFPIYRYNISSLTECTVPIYADQTTADSVQYAVEKFECSLNVLENILSISG